MIWQATTLKKKLQSERLKHLTVLTVMINITIQILSNLLTLFY